ncbi:MAG TPA: zinc ribbon domain-containing protein [Capsulimonadaceae bacterium]
MTEQTQSTCPHCGAPQVSDAAFCSKCGKATTDLPATCPGCGSQLVRDAAFCGKCGRSATPKQAFLTDAAIGQARRTGEAVLASARAFDWQSTLVAVRSTPRVIWIGLAIAVLGTGVSAYVTGLHQADMMPTSFWNGFATWGSILAMGLGFRMFPRFSAALFAGAWLLCAIAYPMGANLGNRNATYSALVAQYGNAQYADFQMREIENDYPSPTGYTSQQKANWVAGFIVTGLIAGVIAFRRKAADKKA